MESGASLCRALVEGCSGAIVVTAGNLVAPPDQLDAVPDLSHNKHAQEDRIIKRRASTRSLM